MSCFNFQFGSFLALQLHKEEDLDRDTYKFFSYNSTHLGELNVGLETLKFTQGTRTYNTMLVSETSLKPQAMATMDGNASY